MGKINQIKLKDTQEVFDIEAKSLDKNNNYEANRFDVNTTSGSAIIGFNETAEGGGVIEYNSKGNLAVESKTKHVNIEAKKGIQMKPTTNIIFDSSRRILNGKGNEVHLQFVFDDYDSTAKGSYPGDDEEYAELKIEARNVDIRCLDHGGIALQPCGVDGSGNENKIKFESSRTSPLGDANPNYSKEGGKGLEFGTFNNEHSSLFTGDYRFNKDGIVYAVTRETPVTADGKTDYPTQNDDFKDVIDSNLGVKWETIVKTARVFDALSVVSEPTAEDLLTAFNSVFHPSSGIEPAVSSVSPEVVEYPQQVSQFVAAGENFDRLLSSSLTVFVYEGGQKVDERVLSGTRISSTRIDFNNEVQLTAGQTWRAERMVAYDAEHEFEPIQLWPSE